MDSFKFQASLPQQTGKQSLPPNPCLDIDILTKHRLAFGFPLQAEMLKQSHSRTTWKAQLSSGPIYMFYYITYNL